MEKAKGGHTSVVHLLLDWPNVKVTSSGGNNVAQLSLPVDPNSANVAVSPPPPDVASSPSCAEMGASLTAGGTSVANILPQFFLPPVSHLTPSQTANKTKFVGKDDDTWSPKSVAKIVAGRTPKNVLVKGKIKNTDSPRMRSMKSKSKTPIVGYGGGGGAQRAAECPNAKSAGCSEGFGVMSSYASDECFEQGRGYLLSTAQVFSGNTRNAIFYALIKAVFQLGNELCDQLNALLREINSLHAEQDKDKVCGQTRTSSSMKPCSSSVQLPLAPKAGQKAFVQNAANKVLQLPAMTALTTKASIQQCFLRTLNTLIMLRENANEQNEEKLAKESEEASNGQTVAVGSEGATPSKPDEPMETDQASASKMDDFNSPLSRFLSLNKLWDFLGKCLRRLSESNDPHIVLVLQPAVEAFFLVHASKKREKIKADNRNAAARVDVGERRDSGGGVSTVDMFPSSPPIVTDSLTGSVYQTSVSQELPEDTKKFIRFAEEHRTVLNQILHQSNEHLADGPFAVLVDYTRILDFDVKRRYFRKELERSDDGFRREDVAVRIRRDHVFQDSFRELFRLRPHEWKSRFYIIFEGEEGQDAGGLLREWYSIITREIFNADYALFQTAPGDRVTYMINPSSYINVEHLDYFKFVGRLIAKAVYDNKLLDCFFTRAFYKHILSKQVKYNDLESEDPSFYQSLVFLLENPVEAIGHLTFSLEVQEFGLYEIRDLKNNGRNIPVTEENKKEYVRLVCQMKMTGAIRQQLNAFLTGFYDIIPRHLISIFNEQELELLISGLPNIDVDDLQANTEYNKYTKTSLQIQWFWRALRSFDQADRAKFLQFVTGTSKVPLQGFAALEGMHGIQKFQIHRDDRSTYRLPIAHTCFNQLDLPPYETYDKLKDLLLIAIRECTEGFGFA